MTIKWHLNCFKGLQDILCVKEMNAGLLMLLVSVAILVQIDPRIWSSLCELIGRLIH